ncbi:MAG: sulfite exporter TauE/SafE family protein [Acidobacteria bacterium]|nr:sulfite exporter TauE/SafE family protein [Acidobacteriota bacterium]
MFEVLVGLAAVAAGAIAAVSGFGIGSLLTPLTAAFVGTKLAVAFVSLPHFIGTGFRFVLLREHLDRKVLMTFGITSAIGGLIGALLQIWLRSVALGYILGTLLVFAGALGITGFAARLRFGRAAGWIAGALSGIFGGLVGNQGGIRSAALLGFDVSKESFVATATAIALMVDLFRVPVYLVAQYEPILEVWPAVVIATVGAIVGTMAGKPLLKSIPEPTYRKVVSTIILALGVWMFLHPGG